MGKKLAEIEEIVNESTIEFLEYIRRNVDAEVYGFLLKLSEKTNLYIFSGVIRNFFLGINDVRDLDVVIEQNIDIKDLFGNDFPIRLNSFGGYKIDINNVNVDLWLLEKTWAIQYQKRLDIELDSLHKFIPSTAFFNFSAILYSFNEHKFYYKNDFLRFIRDKEINYVYKPNANYSLCVVNSLYYADKYNLKIAGKLKRFLIQLYKTKLNYTDIQLKHFGEILYTDEEIKQRISNFKIEKRQVSNHFTENLDEVFKRLGLNKDNGLFITKEENWKSETAFPNRVKRLIERDLRPNAFFCFDNKPLILFFENPINKYDLHKIIWNFNECPIAIIIENNIVEIFNGFDFDLKLNLLKKIGKEDKLSNFTYFELVTGKTWEQYKKHLNYKNRVDYNLLQNIKSARNLLVEKNKLDSKIANAIIGKAIFVRYLIDRGVKIKFDGKSRTWTNEEFCELFTNPDQIRGFFNYLEDNENGFNGDLFPLSNEEYKSISSLDYLVIKRLLLGETIETNQLSLFQIYNFSIIPIEFISNVYEMFIGQDNQKKEGAYYTPLFLVDYILKETVEDYIGKIENRLITLDGLIPSNNFSICKVLDPACGSGIFLVETLRKIIEKYIAVTNADINSDDFKEVIKELAKDNIFGIDKDLSAVQVAIFSIYLTLLDYLEPPDIETFKFPVLFNTNFFNADFFDEEADFNTKLKNNNFQFILGNPPWKGNGMNALGIEYLKNRKKKEKELGKKYEIAINNNEIAEGFVLRVSDFSNEDTRVSLIIRSSSLYNLGYNDNYSLFRRYWLEEYFVDKVFELAPVRHEVFEKSNQPAIAPAVVLFYRYANGKNTDANVVQHIALKQSQFFSLFKIFTINRSDYKILQQNKFKTFDWIWKILVYGSYLDFNFIKRINEEFESVKNFIERDVNTIEGTGIQYSSDPIYDSSHLLNKDFIDSYGVTSFFLVPNKISSFDKLKVHRLRDEKLFKSPMLLVREGIDMNTLTAKCVVSKKDLLFKDSITSIKSIDGNLNVLNNIAGLFSSSLFSYFAVNMFASIGIERERVKNYNKYSLPYLNLEINDNVLNIEKAYQEIYNEKEKILHDNIKIEQLHLLINEELSEIDEVIYKMIGLDNSEVALIDYSQNISKSLIIGDASSRKNLFSPIVFESSDLVDYALIFKERFKRNIETDQNKFVIEIWHTDQIVGMFFKIIPTQEFTSDIVWINKQNEDLEILKFLTSISSSRITDRLFVQKDIRGFEKKSFYIFKPNENKLWHKAIAYQDVNEFADAILKEGRLVK